MDTHWGRVFLVMRAILMRLEQPEVTNTADTGVTSTANTGVTRVRKVGITRVKKV